MTHTHTPGQWEESGATIYCEKTIVAVAYCEGNRELHPSIDPSDKLPDADGEIGDGWEEAWSNARLIAAAPDMLKALLLLVDQYDSSGDFTMGGNLTNGPFLKPRAAIAKARGDQ